MPMVLYVGWKDFGEHRKAEFTGTRPITFTPLPLSRCDRGKFSKLMYTGFKETFRNEVTLVSSTQMNAAAKQRLMPRWLVNNHTLFVWFFTFLYILYT